MRSDFLCRSCGMRFTVGWWDEPPFADGYGATARLVCRVCGTEHLIEIALRDRGGSQQRLFDVALVDVEPSRRSDAAGIFQSRFDMTAIEAAESVDLLPIEVARSVSQEIADDLEAAFSAVGTVRVTEVAAAPNPIHGPLRQDRLLSGRKPRFDDDLRFDEIEPSGPRWGPNGEFDLATQSCAHCSARGSLETNPIEVASRCPACGRDSVACVEEWAT